MTSGDHRSASPHRRAVLAGVAALSTTGTVRAAPAQDPAAAARAVIATLRPLARPAVVLEQADRPTVCRLGGFPRLPATAAWPDRKGRPLSFIAELDLTALRASAGPDWLPAMGLLQVFFDVEQEPWGFDPADRDGWKVLMTDGPTGQALPRPPGLLSDQVFAPVALAGRSALTYPTTERFSLPPDIAGTFDFEAVHAFMDAGLGDGPRHQVGGFPSPIQGDAMELEAQLASNGIYMGGADSYSDDRIAALEAGASDWRLLLQIDSDDEAGMMWGDSGILYVWVREQDARAGYFSRVWMILQST